MADLVSADSIRSQFSAAMSNMYRQEVPAYADLLTIVNQVNQAVLDKDDLASWHLDSSEDLPRISQERHGAIRLGTAEELSMIRRVFAVMGMYPVGYYDLVKAGIPVHATAFRPITREALAKSPFRVFTSLLRLDLIDDDGLRELAEITLSQRSILNDNVIMLTMAAEVNGGLSADQADVFITEVLEIFRWVSQANVSAEVYQMLHNMHRLVADVVGFRGPHINHLTPRTLDIEAAHQAMIDHGLPAKAVIEGPPKRQCPVLLRQTSFKAIDEPIRFLGAPLSGTHTARFGEIEARGVALTPKGRRLYDRLLAKTRASIQPNPDGSNAKAYQAALTKNFADFPDDWRSLHDQELAYFRYKAIVPVASNDSLSELLDRGAITLHPILYEDFLPVSAAGIFQSNLGDHTANIGAAQSSRDQFVNALGVEPADEFSLYAEIQTASLEQALSKRG